MTEVTPHLVEATGIGNDTSLLIQDVTAGGPVARRSPSPKVP